MNFMKILFHSNQLSERGTETALYDMAHYSETILGAESWIAAPSKSDMSSFEKFKNRFEDRVIRYDIFHNVLNKCIEQQIENAYWIKGGEKDNKLLVGDNNIIHCVFNPTEPHGEHYLAVSKWLGEKYNVPYMPHIVSLPDIKTDFREHLGIPKEAIVFGRHGGLDQFNYPYLENVIKEVLNQKHDVWFLLMNTKPFSFTHERLVFIDKIIGLEIKTAFINTCDAGLLGRTDGESFGLSMAEYLHQNKPVINNIGGRDRNHVIMMKDKGIFYDNDFELFAILINFVKKDYNVKHLISEFTPELVMKQFKTMLV